MAKLRDIDVPQDYLDGIDFEPTLDGVNDGLSRVGPDRAYWNEVYANALRDALMAKKVLKETRAAVAQELRAASKLGGEKLSQDAIEERTTLDPRVTAAEEMAIHAEVERARINGRVFTLQDVKDAELAYARQFLEEMRGDPTLRGQASAQSRSFKVTE